MRQIESLQVAIHAAKECEIGWRKLGNSVNMTSEFGVSFHSGNYSRKQNIDGEKEVTKNMNQEKPVEEVFCETCVLRMKKLPSTTKSFIQLQISQQFVNAEDLQLPPIPITPLPTNMPQINAYCGPSASQGGNHTHNAFFVPTTST